MTRLRDINLWAARKIVQDIDKEIYIGLLYENPEKKDFVSLLKSREGAETTPVEEVKHYDVRGLM